MVVFRGSLGSVTQRLNTSIVRDLAAECGFALAGVASAGPSPDFGRYRDWVDRGFAGEMRYLSDHRAAIRSNPEHLLPGLKSVICVGYLYDGPEPYSTEFTNPELGWIARYTWGEDYHHTVRRKLEELACKMLIYDNFAWRACVDTAPLLERSYARQAGLGWIGKNTCLINQQRGSWFFLAELLTTLDLEPDSPLPDRCGTCSRCIDACPTNAIVPSPAGGFELDARLCISYFTIELKSAIPEEHRSAIGNNIFGCDICQDVCPWNRKTGDFTKQSQFELCAPPLKSMAELSENQFIELFQSSAVSRAKYTGFLKNVAVAMGNSGLAKFRDPLRKLAGSAEPLIAEHARWGLAEIDRLNPRI